ncbi:MAG: serine/threonine-protein kinase [Pseudobdellovibrio sp.]
MSQKRVNFGSYVLLEKLASGGMAEIYLARSKETSGLNKFVAIKKILPHLSDDAEFVAMFKHEAKVALNLNHNNVISINYFGCENNQYYLVMDYVEGKTIHEINDELKKNDTQFSIEQVLYIIKEACAGLDHAHRCIDSSTNQPLNIIHRDISPQNIMLSFEGAVKVIDFGIAKANTQNNKTEIGTLKGKVGYMSPEQVEGESVDHRSDIFSVAVVLWELITNKKLFSGANNFEVLKNVTLCNIPLMIHYNPHVTPQLERIVGKALAKNPRDRYQTAAELSKALSGFLNSHYPNFSAIEFSNHVQKLFRNEYEQRRQKMVEYSNYNVNDDAESPSALFTPIDIYEPAPPEDYQNPVPTQITMVRDLPDGLTALNQFTNAATTKTQSHDFPTLSKITPAQPYEDINSTENYKAPAKVLIENNKPQPNKNIPYEAEDTAGNRLIKYICVVATAVLCYHSFGKLIKPLLKNLTQTRDLATVDERSEKIKMQTSTPQSAAATTTVNSETENAVYKKAMSIKRGFLSLDLSEENPDIRILINGQQVFEKPPLLMYPVTAEQELTVGLINLKTKKLIEQKIKVKAGESFALIFDLNSGVFETK